MFQRQRSTPNAQLQHSTFNTNPPLIPTLKVATCGGFSRTLGRPPLCLASSSRTTATQHPLPPPFPPTVPVRSQCQSANRPSIGRSAEGTICRQNHLSLVSLALLSFNRDIERFVPIKALINPVDSEVPKTMDLSSATGIMSKVDSTTPSLRVPLLSRGLDEKLTASAQVPKMMAVFRPQKTGKAANQIDHQSRANVRPTERYVLHIFLRVTGDGSQSHAT